MSNPERTDFIDKMVVSHETMAQLDRYAELLAEWNQKFNLISESTLPHIWQRHFLDSAQLLKLIPDSAKTIADLGSGAGFPGLILSILGVKNVRLIESTGKKAGFLQTVIDELKLDAKVHHCRVEDMRDFKADVITARAVAPLPDLLKLSKPLMKKETLCLIMKGQKADVELTESEKYWRFECEKIPSISDESGIILSIRHISAKNAAPHKKRR